jgi:hypothetical protein
MVWTEHGNPTQQSVLNTLGYVWLNTKRTLELLDSSRLCLLQLWSASTYEESLRLALGARYSVEDQEGRQNTHQNGNSRTERP